MGLNYSTSIAHHDRDVLYKRAIQAASAPKVPKPDQAATSGYAKNKEGPKPGKHVQLFRMGWDRNKKSANWRPPSLCTMNGLGVLCLGMCYCRFAILSRAPNGVSNEHSCSDCVF